MDADLKNTKPNKDCTACISFSTGETIFGTGFGWEGTATGELCFNTAMTGYQEILSDPSYAGQIIVFTFPHIGNTGINNSDNESETPSAVGLITRNAPYAPSNWQSIINLNDWLKEKKIIGISGVDTRSLTRLIRNSGAKNVAISYSEKNKINTEEIIHLSANASGLAGKELANSVTTPESYVWSEKSSLNFAENNVEKNRKTIVAIDYGAKTNIFKSLRNLGLKIVVVPATTKYSDIMSYNPSGIFLSNGPGDPKATFRYAGPELLRILNETNLPIFGICLGHQLLALASGAQTIKMNHGHHGANHPIKDLETGRVEITSMNHGFTVNRDTLPENVQETHISLFDNSNCGLKFKDRPIFSVQYHPEASPGPQDSIYLFKKFASYLKEKKSCKTKYG